MLRRGDCYRRAISLLLFPKIFMISILILFFFAEWWSYWSEFKSHVGNGYWVSVFPIFPSKLLFSSTTTKAYKITLEVQMLWSRYYFCWYSILCRYMTAKLLLKLDTTQLIISNCNVSTTLNLLFLFSAVNLWFIDIWCLDWVLLAFLHIQREQFPFLRDYRSSRSRTTFYYILGLLIFMEDSFLKFKASMDPILQVFYVQFDWKEKG